MLKNYEWKGLQWQFNEGEAPAGAVPVEPKKEKAVEPSSKAVKPANKARKAVKSK